ncbi:MAG: hypothetical protein RLZZ518_1330 [Actinomycetota bacterium]|jgi:hypothetical protein
MHLEASLHTPASPQQVLGFVDALDNYPQWMSLVHSAVRVADATTPTWLVELRAKVGPFARSKRLRMERTTYDIVGVAAASTGGVGRIVFERRENDGRQHAAWRLEVIVTAAGDGATNLVMHLHYDGKLFVSVVEAILQQNIDAGRSKLGELLAR